MLEVVEKMAKGKENQFRSQIISTEADLKSKENALKKTVEEMDAAQNFMVY